MHKNYGSNHIGSLLTGAQKFGKKLWTRIGFALLANIAEQDIIVLSIVCFELNVTCSLDVQIKHNGLPNKYSSLSDPNRLFPQEAGAVSL